MQLVERATFLSTLQSQFKNTAGGEGHCVFVSGEAGIGKTSLVKAFLDEVKNDSIQYTGACDFLFTPRPLAPLYDIALQMNEDWTDKIFSIPSKEELFSKFLQAFTRKELPVILVFEDVHWADEATLDFIKFFSRRISRTQCLFIITYRADEVSRQHVLHSLPGELMPGTFTHILLTHLSMQAVEKLADEKGYNAEDVYAISGGNPFYVNEILASYSLGVPDNIKNAVLSVYNRQNENTKKLWQLLAVIPEGLEMSRLLKLDVMHHEAIEDSLEKQILIIKKNKIFFKHELYRRTIESSLSPFKRIELNKFILTLFLKDFEQQGEVERIVHYAKNANENNLVIQYAPIAARHAAEVGAHIEAAKLYYTAIEYYQENDKEVLRQFYEPYAYECYLTNRIKEAIIYEGKSLQIHKANNDVEKTGNSLRFLSRLWWYEGNRNRCEALGNEAIEVLDKQLSSKEKAMAYSNMAQLKLSIDKYDECILWGEKAMAMAKEVGDEETLAYVLNILGSTLMLQPSSVLRGIELVQQSLDIALKNSYHEQVARAYTTLGSNGVTIKDFQLAKKNLDEGISYCEERDLDSLKFYMTGWKARLNLETGNWNDANSIAEGLIKNENVFPVITIGALLVKATIQMRRGEPDALSLLMAAKTTAFEITELQRIIPVLLSLLEYEWITGTRHIDDEELDKTINMFRASRKISKKSRLYFWLQKARKNYLSPDEGYEEDDINNAIGLEAAALWQKRGCAYEQALCLFEGNEDDKRKAITIVYKLGANAVYEKMKQEMRSSGINKIPRGIRETTKSNPAQLTSREMDILQLLKDNLQNKEIASKLFISPKTVDHHISSILFKLEVNSRAKAAQQALRLGIIK